MKKKPVYFALLITLALVIIANVCLILLWLFW